MINQIVAGNEYIIGVGEHIWQSVGDIVDETLESFTGVFESERHVKKLKESKWCGNGCLLNVVGVHGYLVISFDYVELAEDMFVVECER